MKVDLDKLFAHLVPKTTKKPPAKHNGGYLSSPNATAVFNSLKGIQWDILYNRYGKALYRRTKTYYDGDAQSASNYMNAYGDKGAVPIPFTQAPPELEALRKRIQKDYPGNPLSVCYINYYYSGTAVIGWHQDREEHGNPLPMFMATVYGSGAGKTRNFSVLEMDGSVGKAAWGVPTGHGDLIQTDIGFHDDYFHTVLKEKSFCRPRISLTFRNVDLSANGQWFWYGFKPQVWDCHAGKQHPPEPPAVYVGCTTRARNGKVIRQGTIFGNATNPLKSHHGWLKTAAEFRAYAIKKMEDPAFAAQVAALQGKHLLCWCKPGNPDCHAKVWLSLANPDLVETWDDSPLGPHGEQLYFPNFLTPKETQALYDAYAKLGYKDQGRGFSRFPDWSDVVTPRMVKHGFCRGPMAKAPPETRALVAKISKQFKRDVNYISTIGYKNEDSSMFYHQHGEDYGHDTPVWIVTTGAARTFGLRRVAKPKVGDIPSKYGTSDYTKGDAKTEIRFQVEPGSLLMLPDSFNYTHQHAILKDKTSRGMRIAPNMKAMDAIYYGKKGGK
ncbi:MAG: alpha-ketoglutarate-dependent dioxygenase AlkB [Candidatus Acidiferrales bacterium]